MANISTGTVTSFFLQKHSALLRVWHWLVFLVLTASMITVLLGSTVLRTRNNVAMVQEQLKAKGITVTTAQAKSVAHEYSDKMWILHTYLGYALGILLLCRIFIETAQPGDEKFGNRLRSAMALRKRNDLTGREAQHYVMVKRGYLIFYLLLLIMALTGLVLAFEDVDFLRPIHGAASTIHQVVQYGMYAFVVLHTCGVILADLGKDKGIVSGMINGGSSSAAAHDAGI